MKKLLIGLLVLGSFSSFAYDNQLSEAIVHVSQSRIIYLECESDSLWECAETAKALKNSMINQEHFTDINDVMRALSFVIDNTQSTIVRSNLASIYSDLDHLKLTGRLGILNY
jgi:hypothetical protein